MSPWEGATAWHFITLGPVFCCCLLPAAGLETELIRVAVELESSRLAKVAGATNPSTRLRSPEDIQASLLRTLH